MTTNTGSIRSVWQAVRVLALTVSALLLVQICTAQNAANSARTAAGGSSESSDKDTRPYAAGVSASSYKEHSSESSDKDTRPYDKHDFNGLWARKPSSQFHQPPCPECQDAGITSIVVGYGFFGDVPPRTPEGEKRLQANRPTKGYLLGSKKAAEHMNVDIGFRRALQSSLANDPEERCEPLGLVRLVTFSGGNAAMQIVQTNEIIVQKFEWFWDNREIWLDGRG
ncbi:MAG: hypothetical protein M3O20_10720, partial [Acidobacteriota bacterium]|nr:hypothetical protein [Acidobacteriota bacterium]